MSARKPQVHLIHKTFGEVVVIDGWTTIGNDCERYFTVRKPDGFEGQKKLLASPEFWLNPPEEIERVFQQCVGEHEANRKKALACEHARDRREAQINLTQSLAMEALDSQEVSCQ